MTVKATGILQSFTFDGTTVTYRNMLKSASIPLNRVGSVSTNGLGTVHVDDTGGRTYTVKAFTCGKFKRELTSALANRT